MSCWYPAQEQHTVRGAAVGCQVHKLGKQGELKRAWISHIKERRCKFLAACSERTHLWSYQQAHIWYPPYTGCWEPCRLDRARLNALPLLNLTGPLSWSLSSRSGSTMARKVYGSHLKNSFFFLIYQFQKYGIAKRSNTDQWDIYKDVTVEANLERFGWKEVMGRAALWPCHKFRVYVYFV